MSHFQVEVAAARLVRPGLVLFGTGSALTAEYEETCRRLSRPIAAFVRNRPGPVHAARDACVVEADALPGALLGCDFLAPLFTPGNRRIAVAEAEALGLSAAEALVDPTAILASTAALGRGSFVNAGCILGAVLRLGRHAIVNRGASLGHHLVSGDFVSIGPGAVIAGQVMIGDGAMIGAGAVIGPDVRIGAEAVIAPGAVVLRDVPERGFAVGNPARVTVRRV